MRINHNVAAMNTHRKLSLNNSAIKKNLGNSAENLQAAESRIRDADMAQEVVDYTKNVILTQSAIAMLAQANTKTQSVLQLLG